MNHTALQSALPIEHITALRSIISERGDDNTLKALAGILAEMGKPKTAQYVLVARTESLIETPTPKSPPPLPLQWWGFSIDLVRERGDRVLDSGKVYVRADSEKKARRIAEEHVRDTWGMARDNENEPQRIDCEPLGVQPDTTPLFNRPETVFTIGMPMGDRATY